MSTAGAVTADIAARLLAVDVGAQLPTTARLAEELDVGHGTIHAALRSLRADGLVAGLATAAAALAHRRDDPAANAVLSTLFDPDDLADIPTPGHDPPAATGLLEKERTIT